MAGLAGAQLRDGHMDAHPTDLDLGALAILGDRPHFAGGSERSDLYDIAGLKRLNAFRADGAAVGLDRGQLAQTLLNGRWLALARAQGAQLAAQGVGLGLELA